MPAWLQPDEAAFVDIDLGLGNDGASSPCHMKPCSQRIDLIGPPSWIERQIKALPAAFKSNALCLAAVSWPAHVQRPQSPSQSPAQSPRQPIVFWNNGVPVEVLELEDEEVEQLADTEHEGYFEEVDLGHGSSSASLGTGVWTRFEDQDGTTFVEVGLLGNEAARTPQGGFKAHLGGSPCGLPPSYEALLATGAFCSIAITPRTAAPPPSYDSLFPGGAISPVSPCSPSTDALWPHPTLIVMWNDGLRVEADSGEESEEEEEEEPEVIHTTPFDVEAALAEERAVEATLAPTSASLAPMAAAPHATTSVVPALLGSGMLRRVSSPFFAAASNTAATTPSSGVTGSEDDASASPSAASSASTSRTTSQTSIAYLASPPLAATRSASGAAPSPAAAGPALSDLLASESPDDPLSVSTFLLIGGGHHNLPRFLEWREEVRLRRQVRAAEQLQLERLTALLLQQQRRAAEASCSPARWWAAVKEALAS
ncbi:hypothetical protein HYH03_006281 [Edaphochlamys debaryana]|uniref:Uncharacterized protein n=1 Tax=Edaphochlamys debaryana TaxID=47281 RepID=A0A835Y7M7_9CHLO|nr:hypothetical protein HYH03_006281 [Edaphochlamys debaryana]|eukprot:KAG2495681.1 hypothetical protein HYH03_006281 [Edaphochlamys debaryana]